jgi:hypothetical protein
VRHRRKGLERWRFGAESLSNVLLMFTTVAAVRSRNVEVVFAFHQCPCCSISTY